MLKTSPTPIQEQTPPFWGDGTANSPYGRGGLLTESIKGVAKEAVAKGSPQHFDANGSVIRVYPSGSLELVLPGDADKMIDELRAAVQETLAEKQD